jgi:hypothetical protein
MEKAYDGEISKENYMSNEIALRGKLSSHMGREAVKLSWDKEEQTPVAEINYRNLPNQRRLGIANNLTNVCLKHNFMVKLRNK